MKRRELFQLPFLALAPAGQDPSTGSLPPGYVLAAPDDVFVESVSVADGPVSAGDVLLRLRSPTLDRLMEQLTSMKGMMDVAERPFLDGRLDEAIEELRQAVRAAKVTMSATTQLARSVNKRFALGLVRIEEKLRADMEVERVRMQLLAAERAVEDEPKRTTDLRDKLRIAQSHLKAEEKGLSEAQQRLSVKVSQAGRFKASVVVGVFVKKGDPLGRLTI